MFQALRSRVAVLEGGLYKTLRARADERLARRAVRGGGRPKPEHLLTGERGEDAAYFRLRELGYTVVARRWRSARLRGDLDLVAWDGETLVVFEIKTRTARDFAPAELSVDRDKRNQLRQQVNAYLRRIPEPYRAGVPVRFDVLAVYLLAGGLEFEHFRGAFPRVAPRADWVRRG
jgi:putative endonuclease